MLDERIEDNDVVVEFRRFVGWFAVFCEARHLGDNGEFLGKNVTEAKRTIRTLFPLQSVRIVIMRRKNFLKIVDNVYIQ